MIIQDQKGAIHTKTSAVVAFGTLRKQRGGVERVMAWVVLALSFVGSAVALGGGWAALLTGKALIGGLLLGVLIQTGLTWLQWAYADTRVLAWPARLVDALLTAMGWGVLVAPWLQGVLVGQGASAAKVNVFGFTVAPALAGTWLILYSISVFIAWFPENRLVRR